MKNKLCFIALPFLIVACSTGTRMPAPIDFDRYDYYDGKDAVPITFKSTVRRTAIDYAVLTDLEASYAVPQEVKDYYHKRDSLSTKDKAKWLKANPAPPEKTAMNVVRKKNLRLIEGIQDANRSRIVPFKPNDPVLIMFRGGRSSTYCANTEYSAFYLVPEINKHYSVTFNITDKKYRGKRGCYLIVSETDANGKIVKIIPYKQYVHDNIKYAAQIELIKPINRNADVIMANFNRTFRYNHSRTTYAPTYRYR